MRAPWLFPIGEWVPMQIQKALRHLLSTEFWLHGKWFFLSIVIGIVAGVGAIVFQFLSQAVLWATLGCGAGYWPGETAGEFARFPKSENQFSPWILIAVLGAGGLASGLLVYGFAPEAEGHGTDAAIEAFHHKRGYIRWRVPIVKTLASAITIGTGGSGGREGPIAQIGAGFGSFLGTQLKLNGAIGGLCSRRAWGPASERFFGPRWREHCLLGKFCIVTQIWNRTSSSLPRFPPSSRIASIVFHFRRASNSHPSLASTSVTLWIRPLS